MAGDKHSAKLSRTPEHVSVAPRQQKFDLAGLPKYWHGSSVFKTAFFNALSSSFPLGEQFFIDSVRHYQPAITDPKLSAEVNAFCGQEGIHSREHRRYNAMLTAQGYDIDRLEARYRTLIEFGKAHFPPIRQLADTCALEHFTAIMANGLLTNPDWLAEADPQMAALWRWHAVEETEHKSVCFDVYLAVGGSHRMRCGVMAVVTLVFMIDMFWAVRRLLKTDGQLWNLKVWREGLGFLWGRTGVVRKILPDYFAYYRRGFHPWQQDNSKLIAEWETGIAE